MFASITTNPVKPYGKYNGPPSVHGKATHYTNEGYTDNEFKGA